MRQGLDSYPIMRCMPSTTCNAKYKVKELEVSVDVVYCDALRICNTVGDEKVEKIGKCGIHLEMFYEKLRQIIIN